MPASRMRSSSSRRVANSRVGRTSGSRSSSASFTAPGASRWSGDVISTISSSKSVSASISGDSGGAKAIPRSSEPETSPCSIARPLDFSITTLTPGYRWRKLATRAGSAPC